ncbi:NUDIX domain-containing protein [Paenibacillus sp. UNC496MF]|uniref:NUDIX domain-containing protein n=1 Tax=Paenibacillus sp. UNC496MF TaxID=1502753 RepID=UPI002737C529|nr:NUDIX domain-containing protein [Paenibacillus sp. UNC496MF]
MSGTVDWGPVTGRFVRADDPGDLSLVSNVSIVPHIGDRVVMIRLDNGRWELPGGTLEEGEPHRDGLRRELLEELGAELVSDFQVFGYFDCRSSAPAPYRPYIPHPRFRRLVGHGEVELVGMPLNPPDGERVVLVEPVPIDEAVRRFLDGDRQELAELYRLGHALRRLGGSGA